MAMHVLLVSPIPSHPTHQGNSARINAVGQLLQSAGVIVHFLYYQMEGLTSSQLREMEDCWDFVHLVPCTPRSMAPTGKGSFNLDDWADPLVSEVATALHRRFHFQAVLANYVWFSAVLQAFNQDVLKVLDTHDVFGGRDQRFRDAGLAPEWYFTTEQEEMRGLARADIVLAIQEEEAAYFRRLGHPDVRVLGHMLGLRHRQLLEGVDAKRTVGYLASGNPLNTTSFDRLRRGLAGRATRSSLKFLVAGSICEKLTEVDPFTSLGRVDQLDDFYDRIDIVVNPMIIGTGLKIKSVEAISCGIPLLATTSAMTGLSAKHHLHAFAHPEDLADCLAREHFNDALLTELAAASRDCASDYVHEVRAAAVGLVQSIHGGGRAKTL
jgi:glycosyltransferase involved in cell wall biosynthesis